MPPQLTHMALEAIVPEKGPFPSVAFHGFSTELWHLLPTLAGKQGRTSWVRLMGLLAYGQHS